MKKRINCEFSNENNGNCKVSDIEVTKIRESYATGEYTFRSLGAKYSVSHSQIRRIVRGLQR